MMRGGEMASHGQRSRASRKGAVCWCRAGMKGYAPPRSSPARRPAPPAGAEPGQRTAEKSKVELRARLPLTSPSVQRPVGVRLCGHSLGNVQRGPVHSCRTCWATHRSLRQLAERWSCQSLRSSPQTHVPTSPTNPTLHKAPLPAPGAAAMAEEFRRAEVKQFPQLQQRTTPEDRFWQRFRVSRGRGWVSASSGCIVRMRCMCRLRLCWPACVASGTGCWAEMFDVRHMSYRPNCCIPLLHTRRPCAIQLPPASPNHNCTSSPAHRTRLS